MLKSGSTFTQADVDATRLSYKSLSGLSQLSNNTTQDFAPAISGSNIVWTGYDGTDYEIYYSNVARSDRFSFTVSDGAGGSTAGTFNFTLTP